MDAASRKHVLRLHPGTEIAVYARGLQQNSRFGLNTILAAT
jgi:hypothetical protein